MSEGSFHLLVSSLCDLLKELAQKKDNSSKSAGQIFTIGNHESLLARQDSDQILSSSFRNRQDSKRVLSVGVPSSATRRFERLFGSRSSLKLNSDIESDNPQKPDAARLFMQQLSVPQVAIRLDTNTGEVANRVFSGP